MRNLSPWLLKNRPIWSHWTWSWTWVSVVVVLCTFQNTNASASNKGQFKWQIFLKKTFWVFIADISRLESFKFTLKGFDQIFWLFEPEKWILKISILAQLKFIFEGFTIREKRTQMESEIVSVLSADSVKTHHWGKYHCMADLLFDWFGFDQSSKADANST